MYEYIAYVTMLNLNRVGCRAYVLCMNLSLIIPWNIINMSHLCADGQYTDGAWQIPPPKVAASHGA